MRMRGDYLPTALEATASPDFPHANSLHSQTLTRLPCNCPNFAACRPPMRRRPCIINPTHPWNTVQGAMRRSIGTLSDSKQHQSTWESAVSKTGAINISNLRLVALTTFSAILLLATAWWGSHEGDIPDCRAATQNSLACFVQIERRNDDRLATNISSPSSWSQNGRKRSIKNAPNILLISFHVRQFGAIQVLIQWLPVHFHPGIRCHQGIPKNCSWIKIRDAVFFKLGVIADISYFCRFISRSTTIKISHAPK